MYEIFLQLLQKKGVTAYQVAKATNIGNSTFSDWKNGRSRPKQEKLQKIADYFGVTIDYLLGNNEKSPDSTSPDLTSRDKKQIENILENTKQQLLSQDGLMFEGSPATEEDVQKILMALQMGMEMIKKENKEKYTPKKYRK